MYVRKTCLIRLKWVLLNCVFVFGATAIVATCWPRLDDGLPWGFGLALCFSVLDLYVTRDHYGPTNWGDERPVDWPA